MNGFVFLKYVNTSVIIYQCLVAYPCYFKEKINTFSPEYIILFINIFVTYLYDIPIPRCVFVVKKNLFGVYNSNNYPLIYFYIIQFTTM